MDAIKHTRILNSSNVNSVGYDEPTQTLEVKFHDGGTYRYHGVPAAKHQELMRAPSAGKYLNAAIKPVHRHLKVR